jgi:hypothetical protein
MRFICIVWQLALDLGLGTYLVVYFYNQQFHQAARGVL